MWRDVERCGEMWRDVASGSPPSHWDPRIEIPCAALGSHAVHWDPRIEIPCAALGSHAAH